MSDRDKALREIACEAEAMVDAMSGPGSAIYTPAFQGKRTLELIERLALAMMEPAPDLTPGKVRFVDEGWPPPGVVRHTGLDLDTPRHPLRVTLIIMAVIGSVILAVLAVALSGCVSPRATPVNDDHYDGFCEQLRQEAVTVTGQRRVATEKGRLICREDGET